jgi:hypothetical protein
MAKFVLVKIGIMAEITDADALREAALKHFDTADITSDDHPETADWHASDIGQEDRRQIATEDNSALHALVDMTKVKELLDGVPGTEVAGRSSMVVELEGTTKREARDAWGETRGDSMVGRRAGVGGLTPGAQRSRRHSLQHLDPGRGRWWWCGVGRLVAPGRGPSS